MITGPPDTPTIHHLEVVVMPNGEIICLGNTIGFVDKFGKYLYPVA